MTPSPNPKQRVDPSRSRDHSARSKPVVHRWGSPHAVPFVMLHSLGLDGGSFRWLAERLVDRAGVHVVAPDLRGHGSWCDTDGVLTIETMADDVLAMMDRLGLRQAHLLGTSMGVAIARRAVQREPQRWLSASLVAGGPAAVPALALRGDPALAHGMQAVVGTTLERWFSPEAISSDDEFVRYAKACLLAMRPQAWAASWVALASYPPLGPLPEVVPGVCIAGEHDVSATPQVVEALRLATGIAREVEIVADGHHQLAMSRADVVAELLLDCWLRPGRAQSKP